jgi:hypothetical protein
MPAGSKTELTEMRVRAAKPAAKPYKLFDAHQLYLVVREQLDFARARLSGVISSAAIPSV